jgi:hypothetical protein
MPVLILTQLNRCWADLQSIRTAATLPQPTCMLQCSRSKLPDPDNNNSYLAYTYLG